MSDELGGTTPNILSPPSRFHGHSAFSSADFSSVYELKLPLMYVSSWLMHFRFLLPPEMVAAGLSEEPKFS
jgi:hypothetical protein